MVILPVCFRFIQINLNHRLFRQAGQGPPERPETMSVKNALLLPFILSFVLLTIYLVFKVSQMPDRQSSVTN